MSKVLIIGLGLSGASLLVDHTDRSILVNTEDIIVESSYCPSYVSTYKFTYDGILEGSCEILGDSWFEFKRVTLGSEPIYSMFMPDWLQLEIYLYHVFSPIAWLANPLI